MELGAGEMYEGHWAFWTPYGGSPSAAGELVNVREREMEIARERTERKMIRDPFRDLKPHTSPFQTRCSHRLTPSFETTLANRERTPSGRTKHKTCPFRYTTTVSSGTVQKMGTRTFPPDETARNLKLTLVSKLIRTLVTG